MEAQNWQLSPATISASSAVAAEVEAAEPMSPREKVIVDRLKEQDRLREDHKREEAQIRKEKLNLLQQEEMLIKRQEEMLTQIEAEKLNLNKQEDLIRSRQAGRLLHVRQEKQLLEKQEEMLQMREQQLMQERDRQDKLRTEQRALKEQEEAIRKRYEEISKELMMGTGSSDLSEDNSTDSIIVCQAREGQVLRGPQQPQQPPMPVQEALPKVENALEEEEEDSDSEETLDEEDYYETKVEVQQKPTSVPTSVRTIETKIDTPAWAPIAPYLSYHEQESRNQEEVSAIMTKQPSGIITSPESVRTSTNLITTPESSLQSQMSMSSSCPGSPPPVPPLPLDNSFVPVQPDVPPREDSFAAAAAAAYNKDYDKQVTNGGGGDGGGERRSLVDVYDDRQDNKLSPRIGGPGSAFKPYASNENLFDPAIAASFASFNSAAKSASDASSSNSNKQPIRNGWASNGSNGRGKPMHSKVRELRRPPQDPFSQTETEPEMRECNLPTYHDPKRRLPGMQGKGKVPTYSTSETEEEYQAYLRSRHKFPGNKNNHKSSSDSWDPLLVESPPQIVQKPVGIIQKPKAFQATLGTTATSVERGAQAVKHTPIYVQSPLADDNNSTSNAGAAKKIQKSNSVIEVKTNELLPESVTEISRKSLNIEEEVTPEPDDKGSGWCNDVGAPPPPQTAIAAAAPSDQIRTMQEKYLENVQASNSSQPSTAIFGRPKQELPPVSQMMDLHDRVMGEAIRKVEDKKEAAAANAAKKKSFSSIQRTNPTIAAMEIMTRKENAQNAMEERMMGLMQAKQGQQQQRQLSQGAQQNKAKANTSVTASSMSLRPISSPVASQNTKPSNSKHQQSPAPSVAKVQASPQPARKPVVPEPSPVRKAVANSPARPNPEQLRAQKMKEEAERQRKEQEEMMELMERRQRQLEEEQRRRKLVEEEGRRQRQQQEEEKRRKQAEEEQRRQTLERKRQEELRRQREHEEEVRRRKEDMERLEREKRREEQERLRQQWLKEQQMIQKHNQLQKQQLQLQQQQQQQHRVANSAMSSYQEQPLVKPHPSMARSKSEQKMTPEPPVTAQQQQQQPVIILKKQPKILAPDEIRARKNSMEQERQEKAKVAAKAAMDTSNDPMILKNEAVRKAAERFEKSNATEDGGGSQASQQQERGRRMNAGALSKSRSKSIGHNLHQKMMVLDMERERAEGTKSQMTSSMPWSSSASKPPALRRRDANNARNYELRMSKSSDSITAAKMMAMRQMQQQQQGTLGRGGQGGLRINQDMSKSMEKQIDVYTKTRDDIRKILQVT